MFYLGGVLFLSIVSQTILDPIVDGHLHTDFRGGAATSSGILRTQQELLRQLREAGAIAAIGHTGEEDKDYYDLRHLQIYHTAGIGLSTKPEDVERGLREGKYRGIKIYLGYVHRFANDPLYEPFYKLAARYNVPVVFHTGDTLGRYALLKFAHPLTIDEVAVAHPDTDFVIAHMGNPWVKDAALVVAKNPNVYVDTSGFLVGSPQNKNAESLRMLVIEPMRFFWHWVDNPEKIIFGSDWPVMPIAPWAQLHREIFPPEHLSHILCQNAIRVFRLPLNPHF